MAKDNRQLSIDKRYTLTGKVGKGGMGVIYLADDRQTGRQIYNMAIDTESREQARANWRSI